MLTLYLMYEKKVGRASKWAPYIKELDRQRARGAQAVESPLLWGDAELVELLQGSPVVPAVRARLEGIRREYDALDTVWFMAGSLFNRCAVGVCVFFWVDVFVRALMATTVPLRPPQHTNNNKQTPQQQQQQQQLPV